MLSDKTSRALRLALAAALLGGAAGGCVTNERLADDLLIEATKTEASAPLGGEALAQRKQELDRAFRDLTHMHATLLSLKHRGDRSANVLFAEFVETYLLKHVAPLLEGEWQSRHPEVAVLDVNVRFAVAELWLRMSSRGSAERMIAEIERRYVGREQMLVAYPLGSEGTLGDGLQRLRERDWRG